MLTTIFFFPQWNELDADVNHGYKKKLIKYDVPVFIQYFYYIS